jgi:hypothetical protein
LGIDRFLQQRRLLFGKQRHAVPDAFWEQPNAVPALGFNGDQSGALTNAYVTFTGLTRCARVPALTACGMTG